MNRALLNKETDTEFNARIDEEDRESQKVACPLENCGAEIGEPCCTQAGQPRCRHVRRLLDAREEK